jgi:hypothetical protein
VGDRVGLGLADRSRTAQPSGAPLNPSPARPSSKRASTQNVGTSSYAMRGTIERAAPLSCTTACNPMARRSGSVRRTFPSASS